MFWLTKNLLAYNSESRDFQSVEPIGIAITSVLSNLACSSNICYVPKNDDISDHL